MKKIKKIYNNSKFKTKLLIIFGMTAIVPILLILIFSSVLNSKNMTKKVNELMTTNLTQMAERVNLNLEIYTNLVYQIYQDEEINENIKAFISGDGSEEAAAYNQINKRLKQYNTTDSGVRCISVVCSNGNAVIYDFKTDSYFNNLWKKYPDMRETIPYKQAVDQPGMVIVPTTSFYEDGQRKEYFHVAKRVFDLDHLEKGSIATIVVSIDAGVLNSICNTSQKDTEHGINFIMDEEKRIITYPDMQYAGMKKSDKLSLKEFVSTTGLMKNKETAVIRYKDKTTG